MDPQFCMGNVNTEVCVVCIGNFGEPRGWTLSSTAKEESLRVARTKCGWLLKCCLGEEM